MAKQRDLARLTHHADRLDTLILRLGDPVLVDRSREHTENLVRRLYQEVRLALRRDYDAGEARDWTRPEVAITQAALYAAFAELSTGQVERVQRMLDDAKRAHRVVVRASREVEQQVSRAE